MLVTLALPRRHWHMVTQALLDYRTSCGVNDDYPAADSNECNLAGEAAHLLNAQLFLQNEAQDDELEIEPDEEEEEGDG